MRPTRRCCRLNWHRMKWAAPPDNCGTTSFAIWWHWWNGKATTGKFSEEAASAICPIPFPVLRHIEFLKPLSHPKQRAIRELHYDASAKILFQCRRRFWEDDDGISGGGTETDLPVRAMFYPD